MRVSPRGVQPSRGVQLGEVDVDFAHQTAKTVSSLFQRLPTATDRPWRDAYADVGRGRSP